ncbi:putative FTP domain-containing protein [Seiridium unicorne]|uniref:FTP domain-containing protein n=1 Tax=Seiridium unicorne TaxID=138068 RepID=A0ABR2UFX0_9PEZI
MATSKQRFQDVIDFLHRAAQAQGRLNLFSFAFQNVLNDVTRDLRTLQSDGIITNGQLRYAVCRELPGRMNLRYPGAITDAPGCLDGETDLRLISINDLANTLSNPSLTVYDKIQLCKDGQIEEPTTEDQLTQTSAFVAYKFRETAQTNPPAKRHSSSRAAFKFELYRVVHNAIWPQNSLSFHSPPVSFPPHRPSGEPRLKAERLQQASRKRMSVAQILKFIDTGIKVPFLPDVKQSSLQAPSTPTSTTLVYCDRKQEEPAWLNAIDPTSTTQCWYYDPTGSKDRVVGKSGDNSLCYSMDNLNMDMDDEDEDLFRKVPRPFRMAAEHDDPQDVHITDPEFWNLAKALAKADMHCIAFMARGVYKVSSQQFAGLAHSADSWHYPPSSTAPNVSTQQAMEGWSQSIQAFSEKMALSDWVSRNDNQEGRETGPAYLHEIIEVRDDSWARHWVFHQQYLKAAEFEQLWREAFTAATRIEAASEWYNLVLWIENLKGSIDEAAEIVDGFFLDSGPGTFHAVTGAALVLAFVPAMVAWSYSETGPGGSGDADFWWLLASVVFQLLALAIFAIPMLTVNPPRTKGRLWVWIYICIGSTLTIVAIPLYLWASVRYSSAATFLGNVVVALLHIQVSLAAISSAPKRKTE